MFSRYYQSELSYLRELGREFAATNPALTGLFAERGGDPDVERLLEGFAFLTARIRERLDDAVPEVIEQLSQLALPHYVRSVPATSIVEFSPTLRATKGLQRIPRGAELGTRQVDGRSCLFRTTRDLELLPLQVGHAELDASIESAPKVRLTLQTSESGTSIVRQAGGFRLFLHGALPQASMLFYWMTRHLESVRLALPDGTTRELGRDAVRTPVLEDGGSVFPWPSSAPEDMRLALDYYTQPALLLFLDVSLTRVDVALTESFELIFQFSRAPRLPERLEKEAFRLHCVPVVNLFDTTSEPIRRDVRSHEHPVRAAGIAPQHAEVFSVQRVMASRVKAAPIEYEPFFSFSHMDRPPDDQRYYWTRRAISPIDNGVETYVSFGSPRDLAPLPSDEVVSLEITCTNRLLPNDLRVGDISQPTSRSPSAAPFKNIVPVSRPVPPAIGNELHWRFIAHIAVNQRSLSDPAALRSILGLYNVHESADHQLGRANRLRVDAIRDVQMRASKRLLDHVPTRGVDTTIELDETAFASLGDLHLFGCALDWFFASQAPVNTFHRLTILAHPSGNKIEWSPKSGIEPVF